MNETSTGETSQAFGTAFRAAVGRANLAYNEVSRRSGISAGLISKYKNGAQVPRLDELQQLADALRIDVVELWDAYQLELAKLRR